MQTIITKEGKWFKRDKPAHSPYQDLFKSRIRTIFIDDFCFCKDLTDSFTRDSFEKYIIHKIDK